MLKIFRLQALLPIVGALLFSTFFSAHRPFATEQPERDFVDDYLSEIATYPKDYFRSPIHAGIKLTGTFGELRSDHFHSGIDIKSTTGGVGQPVFATADGYVDQIKVQAGGYGNVIYFKHPNGYTTVYAHLDRFAPEIERYVREQQYNREQFEVSLTPKDGLLKFKQGQEIGKLGNSGSSSGPHLHFEIRNTATGKALNPQLFGLPVPDKVAPDIRDMKLYFLNEKREVLGSKPFPIIKTKDGKYKTKSDTVRIGGWRVGFGVKAYDAMTGFKNDNGLYALTMIVDGKTEYSWRMEDLDFDETRFINAHIDYPAKQKYGSYFNRCFVLPGNRLSNYARTESGGAIALFKDKPVKVTIKTMDAGGNVSEITFWALRDEANMQIFTPVTHQFELPFDAESRIDLPNFTMAVPKNCFYETVMFNYQTTPDDSNGYYSDVHHLSDESTPVQKYFEIEIKPTNLPGNLRDKAVIANCSGRKPENYGGIWKNDKLTTKTRAFGDYCIMADTEPPKITPIVFDEDMRKKTTMSFRITDDYGTSGTADALSYRGEVDGKWILLEYDRKRDRLTHTFDGHISAGDHILRLVVKDDRNNEAVLERGFTR